MPDAPRRRARGRDLGSLSKIIARGAFLALLSVLLDLADTAAGINFLDDGGSEAADVECVVPIWRIVMFDGAGANKVE